MPSILPLSRTTGSRRPSTAAAAGRAVTMFTPPGQVEWYTPSALSVNWSLTTNHFSGYNKPKLRRHHQGTAGVIFYSRTAGMIFYLLIRELPAIKADCQPERAGMRKQSSFSPAVYGTSFTGGCLGRISSYS